MADTLGEMILEIDVELTKFRSTLATAKKEAKSFYDDVNKMTSAPPAFKQNQLQSFTNSMNKQRSSEWNRAWEDAAKDQKRILDFTTNMHKQKNAEILASEKAAYSEMNKIRQESANQEKAILDFRVAMNKQRASEILASEKAAYSENSARQSIYDQQAKISMYRDMVLSKSGGMSGVQEQAIKDNERFDAQLKGTTKTLATYEQAIARVQRTLMAFGAVVAFRYISQALSFPVEESVRYNAEIEKTRLGIASIVSAQMEMTSASGEQVKGAEKLNKALTMSDDVMKKLKIDNLSTIATFEQLARAYQSALSPGLAAGMNLDQIRQFSVGMVQAAGAMGVNLDMMAEELRSLLRGTITPRNTIIATNLGITNEDIKKYKANSADLFNFIMGKLNDFAVAGQESQKTFAGIFSNLKDATSMLFGESGNQFF